MCQHFSYEVESLERVRVMNVKLDVPVGQHRALTPSEVKELKS
jgi:23S rRNA pseudouridine2604 synthase